MRFPDFNFTGLLILAGIGLGSVVFFAYKLAVFLFSHLHWVG